MTASRLLVSSTALELLRRRVLPPPLDLPPGFRLGSRVGPAEQSSGLERAAQELRAAGALGEDDEVHPAVGADLQALASPELAVLVRARRPGLEVHACVVVRGVLGTGLLRTADGAVQLSAFPAAELPGELARVVPAPLADRRPAPVETVPLDALLPGSEAGGSEAGAAGRLRRLTAGALHVTVTVGPREDAPGGPVGSGEWVFDGSGWVGLDPAPSVAGRPQVRLVPVEPADLSRWVAPLAGVALA